MRHHVSLVPCRAGAGAGAGAVPCRAALCYATLHYATLRYSLLCCATCHDINVVQHARDSQHTSGSPSTSQGSSSSSPHAHMPLRFPASPHFSASPRSGLISLAASDAPHTPPRDRSCSFGGLYFVRVMKSYSDFVFAKLNRYDFGYNFWDRERRKQSYNHSCTF